HVRQHLADEAHGGEMHLLEGGFPVLVAELIERAGRRAPDARDQDVAPAEPLRRPPRHAGRSHPPRNRGRPRQAPAPPPLPAAPCGGGSRRRPRRARPDGARTSRRGRPRQRVPWRTPCPFPCSPRPPAPTCPPAQGPSVSASVCDALRVSCDGPKPGRSS